jgi:4-hydroxyacetophenone monooxygenase
MTAMKASDQPPAGAPDRVMLRRGVDEANIPALLMCLVQLTGDQAWLQEPFVPHRARGLDDNDTGGLADDVQRTIRDAAYDAILAWADGMPLALPRPANAELAAMLSIAMSEPVPEDYGDVVAFSMQFDPPVQAIPSSRGLKAIVIGGGISGICAGIELQRKGIDYTIFEKNEDFGGTWWENRYPGCGVDTPNLTYTFSCNPTDWSQHFPLQGEIEAYLLETARSFDLYKHARFGTKVERAEWIAGDSKWKVTTTDREGRSETHLADIVMSAVGLLNIPNVPHIPGLDTFTGEVLHTSAWRDDVELAGKRVAVIGNGASGMQVAPAIADEVAEMTIFARSKQWIAPFPQFRKAVPEGVRYLMRAFPLYRHWVEQRLSWTFNDRVHGTLFRDPDWADSARSINRINDGHRQFFTSYYEEQLGDRQDLLPLLLPDYPPFLKRMLLDNGWFRTLRKPHVRLIPEHLAEVRGDTLVAASGEEVQADVLILATGFQTTNVLGSYDVIGRDGLVLRDVWDGDNAAAYLGTLVPGFPNFFILLGPNVGAGHGGSMIRNIENQAHYALRIIDALIAQDASSVEVRDDVYRAYVAKLDAAHEKLVWTHPGAENWYRNSRGRIIAITPWRNDAFWRMTRDVDADALTFAHA